MPVSMVCETTATVNAALHDSLATNCSGSAVSETANTSSLLAASAVNNGDENGIENKLAASTMRVLQTKIEYEEVNNYDQKILDNIKSKCIVVNSTSAGPFNGHIFKNDNSTFPAISYTNGLNGHLNNFKNSAGQLSNGNANPNGFALMNGGGGMGVGRMLSSSSSGGDAIVATTSNGVNAGSATTTTTNNNNNNNSSNGIAKRQSQIELPEPKVVLFPREKVRLGWRGVNRKWKIGSGFLNVGNTCYLNSTLQAIFHVPALANWLYTDALEHMENCNDSETTCIICAVAKTLQASQGNQPSVRPFAICSRMKYICKSLVVGRQEDAHEFLRYLIEGMERCYLQSVPNYKSLDQYSKETTPINQILGGYLKSAVRCLACNHVSVTFQHFQDLLLDIRKGDTMEQALDVYFSRERLEDMGYKCESCRKKVSATKQFSLERAPYVLCIQLKRFSMAGAKINKHIQIRPRIDLSKYATKRTSEPLTYRLVSLITHLGSSPNCGHYTAIGLTQSGTYFTYDDGSVYPCGIQNVCSTNAYIIFYEMDSTFTKPDSTPNSSTNVTSNSLSAKENYQGMMGSPMAPNSPPNNLSAPLALPGYNKPLPLTTSNNSSNNSSNGLIQPCNKPKAVISFIKTPGYYTNGSIAPAQMKPLSSYNNSSSYQNGLMNGSLRFQDLAQMDTSVVNTANRLLSLATPHNNDSSISSNVNDSNAFSDSEDELNSIQQKSSSNMGSSNLPSMPHLFENVPPKTPIPKTTCTLNAPIKSLEPYFSDTDDEAEPEPSNNKKPDSSSTNATLANGSNLINNRTNHRLSSSSSDSDTEGANSKKQNGFTNGGRQNGLEKKPSTPNKCSSPCPDNSSDFSDSSPITACFSPNKQNEDSIDEIFNNLKKNKTNGGGYTVKTSSGKQQHLENGGISAKSRNTVTSPDLQKNKRFKRSLSTPPETAVIETKAGIWQVEPLNESSKDDSEIPDIKNDKQTAKVLKNPNNPFAAKPLASDIPAKRPKMSSNNNNNVNRRNSTNGYHFDTAKNNTTVNDLLKQSHRGYGTSVSSWNGGQNEIEKESLSMSSNNGSNNLHVQANTSTSSSDSLNNHSIIDNNIEHLVNNNDQQLRRQASDSSETISGAQKQEEAIDKIVEEDKDENCCPKDDMIVEDERLNNTDSNNNINNNNINSNIVAIPSGMGLLPPPTFSSASFLTLLTSTLTTTTTATTTVTSPAANSNNNYLVEQKTCHSDASLQPQTEAQSPSATLLNPPPILPPALVSTYNENSSSTSDSSILVINDEQAVNLSLSSSLPDPEVLTSNMDTAAAITSSSSLTTSSTIIEDSDNVVNQENENNVP